MKLKTTLFYLFLCKSLLTFCQSEFLSNIENPGGMVVHNNFLYYTTDSPDENIKGRIYKVDLSVSTPTEELVFSNIFSPRSLALHGSELYVICLNGDLHKANLDETSPALNLLQNVTGSSFTNTRTTDLTIHNGFIYTSLKDQKKIVRIPLNNDTSNPEEIITTGLTFPSSITFVGNDMYYIDFVSGNGSRLFKLKDTDKSESSEIVVNRPSSVNDIEAFGTDIYMIHGNSAQRISRVDSTVETLPIFEETLINGLDFNSVYMLIHKGEIFVSTFQTPTGRIQKYTVNTLSTNTFIKNEFSIFPNPASNFITISSNIAIKNVEIFSTLGKRVLQVTSRELNDNTIDISNFTSGIYLLKINNKQFKKLIIN